MRAQVRPGSAHSIGRRGGGGIRAAAVHVDADVNFMSAGVGQHRRLCGLVPLPVVIGEDAVRHGKEGQVQRVEAVLPRQISGGMRDAVVPDHLPSTGKGHWRREWAWACARASPECPDRSPRHGTARCLCPGPSVRGGGGEGKPLGTLPARRRRRRVRVISLRGISTALISSILGEGSGSNGHNGEALKTGKKMLR